MCVKQSNLLIELTNQPAVNYLFSFSQQDFRLSLVSVSSNSLKSLTGVGIIMLLLRPRFADVCMLDSFVQLFVNGGILAKISSVLNVFLFRRRLPRFESKPLRALYTHVESVLRSSTECNKPELRIDLFMVGFMNRVSPITSLSSSSLSI